MATNQTGIVIVIKAFLPTGKTIDEQLDNLNLVKAAHESGDYSAVLKAAHIDEVKAEQKTRRVEDQPQPEQKQPATEGEQQQPERTEGEAGPSVATENDENDDKDVPEFLKKGKNKKAA